MDNEMKIVVTASMRPEDFSPGNQPFLGRWCSGSSCFNEAGGFLPRKLDEDEQAVMAPAEASMRPEDFSPGNTIAIDASRGASLTSFNEAGGFLPRKHRNTLRSGLLPKRLQ